MPLEASSSFRRCGQRDDRRRRLLTDDLSNPDDSLSVPRLARGRPRRRRSRNTMGTPSSCERQWRLLDLVPRRLLVLMLLLLAGIAIIAGLEAAYAWMLERVAAGGARRGGARHRRQRQPRLLVLLACCCWPRRWRPCWSTPFADTEPTTTKADTASGSGPPAVGF